MRRKHRQQRGLSAWLLCGSGGLPAFRGGFFLGGSGLRGIWEELTAVADRPSTHTRDVLAGFEAVVNYGRGSPTCSLFQRQLEESSILPLILPDFAE